MQKVTNYPKFLFMTYSFEIKFIRNSLRINVFIRLTSFQEMICGLMKSKINIAQITSIIMTYHLNKNVSKDVSEKLAVSAFRTVIKMIMILGIVLFAWMIT